MNEIYRIKLKQYIKENGLKQRFLAKKLGITEQYLCMFLRNKRDFGNKLLKQINNILNN
ncbi:helix-turn-helix transcriptional regulator [Clostridium tetani]|uniref:XRE family transcriptional regulator n=1 Tax=Clostridium tetani TaxID=1513 RepID=A0ABY0EPS1_CLOTA|nr:helix-turn-helix transcriptional regulator [Clostridium tetani]RXI56731.1 XRE family transcriptional regulator [Clostridium tetani]RXI65922.1 XRE family transcriptional regulator [Clostridium tetani]CDI50394.1 Helix-turn-helix domain protein [Clostridium tetani 12124569]